MIIQLKELYLPVSKNAKKQHSDFLELTQMYPEKICANSYMQGLTLLNKLAGQEHRADLIDAYCKVLRDFLIITCAQAQDPKNPTIIKDIKSLKVIYPSGQGCAVTMKDMIDCVASIITLPLLKEEGPASHAEFRQLISRSSILILSSHPESLLLAPATKDRKDVGDVECLISARVQLLDFLSKNAPVLKDMEEITNFGSLLALLKSNFDLGVLQICRFVLQIYA
mmetsp:Transcript_7476/g.11659  ORF Transcript_7476/g.11659 Transcript_7476/m.11659 type:complete len:225 (+) Transcript_7476:364-1038(+)|eukprot:CAMPEP_0170490686 /NCGR_PEP_ID=MMETSP0208-20121228/8798_1 /TAXON_ID=197538 /ORGANISM="Strombidium inclinatum, Strain S3" /LENGTH=224 /DNA_ID=CAMNT_0010766127 /DNA_START=4307 /DNA_END=4981 /DNA_ORIENTATION=-